MLFLTLQTKFSRINILFLCSVFIGVCVIGCSFNGHQSLVPPTVADIQKLPDYQEAIRSFSQHNYKQALGQIDVVMAKPANVANPDTKVFLVNQRLRCEDALYPQKHLLKLSQIPVVDKSHLAKFSVPATKSDCGPRALLLVCQERGVHTTLNQLTQLAGTNKQGTSMRGMLKAANALGLKASGVQLDMQALKQLQGPAVAWVDGDHYIVILSMGDGNAKIHDPNKPTEEQITLDELWNRSAGIVVKFSA